jgi:MFS transporter, OPA family, glycerol-3-phosphate transporter
VSEVIQHSSAFRQRRFLNWFPLGLTYALLYMGRYNLTVAKNELGDLMTKEDFGIIFAAGTLTYAFAFLFNGPLVDRIGGRKGMLIGAVGSSLANLVMCAYLYSALADGDVDNARLRLVFSGLYAVNMYFQSYGAVSIVKVNASWFHVGERGGFSGIFGTMISSGIFLAFTVNQWILQLANSAFGVKSQWVVFAAPGVLLAIMVVVEYFLLQDRPSGAGHEDFDTGDASSGDDDDTPLPTRELFRKIFTNPVIMTVAAIEFCTGILRNGVMHWFPIYAKEVWVLPRNHVLMYGGWDALWLVGAMFVVAAVSGVLASKTKGHKRGYLVVFGALAFLAPFVQGGWGGLLFIAGVIGGNVAGWVSQLFFQSRRAPAAGGLYAILTVCTIGMIFTLGSPTTEVGSASLPDGVAAESYLQAGDSIVSIAGKDVTGWAQVASAVKCWEPGECIGSGWDAKACACSSKVDTKPSKGGAIPVVVKRGGTDVSLSLPDPKSAMKAGDKRKLAARPVLPINPYFLGVIVFMMSLCVIGTHGLLSGTATMDFGGRKGAATAVGVIDGFVYLGTGVQSLALGYLTSRDWSYWPLFLIPFGIIGTLLTLRIWNAKPGSKGAH